MLYTPAWNCRTSWCSKRSRPVNSEKILIPLDRPRHTPNVLRNSPFTRSGEFNSPEKGGPGVLYTPAWNCRIPSRPVKSEKILIPLERPRHTPNVLRNSPFARSGEFNSPEKGTLHPSPFMNARTFLTPPLRFNHGNARNPMNAEPRRALEVNRGPSTQKRKTSV